MGQPISMQTPQVNWTFGQTWANAHQNKLAREQQTVMQKKDQSAALERLNASIKAEKEQFEVETALKQKMFDQEFKQTSELALGQIDGVDTLANTGLKHQISSSDRAYDYQVTKDTTDNAFRNEAFDASVDQFTKDMQYKYDSLEQGQTQFIDSLAQSDKWQGLNRDDRETVFQEGIRRYGLEDEYRKSEAKTNKYFQTQNLILNREKIDYTKERDAITDKLNADQITEQKNQFMLSLGFKEKQFDQAIKEHEDMMGLKGQELSNAENRFEKTYGLSVASFVEQSKQFQDKLTYDVESRKMAHENELDLLKTKISLAEWQKADQMKESIPMFGSYEDPESGDKGFGYNESEVLGSAESTMQVLGSIRSQISSIQKLYPDDPNVLQYYDNLKKIKESLVEPETFMEGFGTADPFTTFLGFPTADSKKRDDIVKRIDRLLSNEPK